MGLLIVAAAILVSIAAGIAAQRRRGERAEALAERMLLGVLYLLLPPLVFFNVAALELRPELGIGLALAWLAVLITGALGYLLVRSRRPRPVVGTIVVAAIAGNTGYLGYPLTAIFLGADRLGEAVVYDVAVAVPVLVLVCFAVGAAFGEKSGEDVRDRFRSFLTRNPLLPAFALALIAPETLAPPVLVELSRALVFAILPLGFFAVGVYLAASSPGLHSLRPSVDVGLAVVLRCLVAPSLLYVLALPLIELPASYLLLMAMPCGLNTLIVASAYGLDSRLAANAIAWSTALVLAAAAAAALAGL